MAEAVLADAPPVAVGELRRPLVAQVQSSPFLHHGDAYFGITHASTAAGERSSAQLELESIALHRASLRLT